MLSYIDLLQQLQTYSSTRFETFRAVPEGRVITVYW